MPLVPFDPRSVSYFNFFPHLLPSSSQESHDQPIISNKRSSFRDAKEYVDKSLIEKTPDSATPLNLVPCNKALNGILNYQRERMENVMNREDIDVCEKNALYYQELLHYQAMRKIALEDPIISQPSKNGGEPDDDMNDNSEEKYNTRLAKIMNAARRGPELGKVYSIPASFW
jgi:hypothetical protein